MIRSSNDNQQDIISIKNSSLKPKDMNSASKISNNNKKQRRKEEKKNKKKNNKKKRSSLAFWFCMGSKADKVDSDRQPYPAQKDKNKGKNKSPKDDKKSKSGSDDKKKSSRDAKYKQFEDKKGRRFSAPPTDWVSMMATLENQNEATTPESKDNLNLNISESINEDRSKSPAGVRYRFDGTLEKPYVYPGGLTFHSMRTPKKNKGKRWNKRSSKKKGSNDNVVEAEIHHTDDEEGVCYYDDDDSDGDNFDESDIRRQFYLRYDSHTRRKSSKKDRRYSMPAELQRRVEMETDVIGAMYGRGASRWVDEERRDGGVETGRRANKDDRRANGEELYDEPYEGSDNESNVSHLMAHSRPSSYYNSPTALQNSDCVYMWHSCEDIPKCQPDYHSEEEIRGSMECLAQGNNESAAASPCHKDKSKDNACNVEDNNSNTRDSVISDDVRGHDMPDRGKSKGKEMSSPKHNDSIFTHNKTSPHSTTQPENTQPLREPTTHHHVIPNSLQQSFNNTSHDLSDDVFSNSMDNANFSQSQLQSPTSKNLKDHFVENNNKPFENPFRRNIGRSSCMPGNKRFFLPPPPTYTPPREEFEHALSKMAEEEKEEERRSGMGEKSRHNRGSQTDLTGESNEEDTLDMVEREKQMTRDKHSEENRIMKKNEVSRKPSNFTIESQNPIEVSTETSKSDLAHQSADSNSTRPSLRDDAGTFSTDDVKSQEASSSHDSTEEDVTYINCPKLQPPLYVNCPKLRPPTSSALSSPSGTIDTSASSSIPSSQGSTRRHTVVTSTPKAKRRSDLSIATSTTNSSPVTTRTPKRPVPTPRQRFSSCLEYSTITLSSPSSSRPLSSASPQQPQKQIKQQQRQQQHEQQSEHQPQQQAINPSKSPLQNTPSAPIASDPRAKPVARKRLSQMFSSDSSYTNADIDEGLKAVFEDTPSGSRIATKPRKELFSNDARSVKRDDEHILSSPIHSQKPVSIREDPGEQGSVYCSHNRSSSSSSSAEGVISRLSGIVHKVGDPITRRDTPAREPNTVLPPLERFQLSRSPAASRRNFSSVFSSSVECLTSPIAKSSGLSSSLDDLLSQIEHTSTSVGRMLSMFPYGDDDDDDENADDEMSVHNEESPLPETPTLEDLLRARSILDRSQAVCRKRRQRLRDRKCQSQILSSTEVDDYMRKEEAIRRRNSRHSSKKKDFPSSSNKPVPSTNPKPVLTASKNERNAFAFDHEITHAPVPTAQSRRFLYRQNRLLNHTDSGLDSDGASPLNSRDFHIPPRDGGRASPRQYSVTSLHVANVRDVKTYSQRAGSKEFLSHSRNSHHIDRNVSVSNGFETLV